jgi:hypothetical protein
VIVAIPVNDYFILRNRTVVVERNLLRLSHLPSRLTLEHGTVR